MIRGRFLACLSVTPFVDSSVCFKSRSSVSVVSFIFFQVLLNQGIILKDVSECLVITENSSLVTMDSLEVAFCKYNKPNT